MIVSWKAALLAGGIALLMPADAGMTAHVSAHANASLPQISGPIPTTATSRPFLGAQDKLKSVGYVEDEYFLSGKAKVYDWTGHGQAVKVVAGPGRYVTRILVSRPRDAARFSGNIEVTVLNASLGVDFGGPIDFDRMAKQGDVWIGITTKALAVKALKKFDPVRYAPLDWSNPAPVAQRCAQPSIIPTEMIGGKDVLAMMAKAGMLGSAPETEDGLVWDMLGDLGRLLKSDRRQAILPGFGKPWLYMTGISQSSIYIRTWIAAFHRRDRLPDGGPIYDGFLGVVGPSLLRINQCSEDVPFQDPRQKLTLSDVPFISISSEGEMWQGRYTHQPDSITKKGGMVTYEVAGASHRAGEVPGLTDTMMEMAPPEDLTKSGLNVAGMAAMSSGAGMLPAGSVSNDFIWQPAIRGAYHNLQQWVRHGIVPPEAPGIAFDDKLEIRRDAHGNAEGGLRMSYIDVPDASHTGYLTPGGMGGVMGLKRPFSPETLKALYPTHATYVSQFSAATKRMINERLISQADGDAMIKAAEDSKIP